MSASKHSQEFRANAARQVLVHGKTASEVARELGLPEWKVRDWVRSVKHKEGQHERITGKSQAAELAELKKRNKQLEMENEILKKATAYFAKALP
jgi:transposase-like protein